MSFPALRPTSRQFAPGNWPIKSFKAQSGAEVRILYGNRRTEMKLELGYENLTDAQSQQFLTHYDSVFGSFQTFTLPASVRAGWTGSAAAIDAATGAAWRYEAEPQVTAARPGRSSVRVSLVAVL